MSLKCIILPGPVFIISTSVSSQFVKHFLRIDLEQGGIKVGTTLSRFHR